MVHRVVDSLVGKEGAERPKGVGRRLDGVGSRVGSLRVGGAAVDLKSIVREVQEEWCTLAEDVRRLATCVGMWREVLAINQRSSSTTSDSVRTRLALGTIESDDGHNWLVCEQAQIECVNRT